MDILKSSTEPALYTGLYPSYSLLYSLYINEYCRYSYQEDVLDIPVKLETTLNNIQLLDNQNNAKLIPEFYLYLRSVNTSESYQNQNIKALFNMELNPTE